MYWVCYTNLSHLNSSAKFLRFKHGGLWVHLIVINANVHIVMCENRGSNDSGSKVL